MGESISETPGGEILLLSQISSPCYRNNQHVARLQRVELHSVAEGIATVAEDDSGYPARANFRPRMTRFSVQRFYNES